MKYTVVFSAETAEKINRYQDGLSSGAAVAGALLKRQLSAGPDVSVLSFEEFTDRILATKKPRIFAEDEIRGGGHDWNDAELSILGDIGVAVPAQAFDNGVWNPAAAGFETHSPPMATTLLFTPGALLAKGAGYAGQTPDEQEIVKGGKIDRAAYEALVERRLLPLLVHASAMTVSSGTKAIVTMPAVGAGVFAGDFRGQMGGLLESALEKLLEKHAARLGGIAVVYYAPFNECADRDYDAKGILLRTRVQGGGAGKSLLCRAEDYEEGADVFDRLSHFKVVAWDHVSLPGNDFFAGSRHTDDGVSAAATDVMKTLTGIPGDYDASTGKYQPPVGYATWEEVVEDAGVRLSVGKGAVVVNARPSAQPSSRSGMKKNS